MDVERGTLARAGGSLRLRLREETAGLHRAVEHAVDLPDSVRTRSDYVGLLTRLHGFHAAAESRLASPSWRRSWSEVGIDLDQHRRAPLLARDLRQLGSRVTSPGPVPRLPELDGFGKALGCLYVLEGSSLGGRVLGPAMTHVLGDVPTAFFDSDGRRHPSPWRAVQEALRRFDADGGDGDDVLAGARSTFAAFGRHVAGDRFGYEAVR